MRPRNTHDQPPSRPPSLLSRSFRASALVALALAAALAPAAPVAAEAPLSGWGVATWVEADSQAHASQPHVALDEEGFAVAVWHRILPGRVDIWANRFSLEAGWGVPTAIETDNTGDASFPDVAVDPGGNATAVWMQNVSVFSIFANRFEVGRGWGRPVLIEPDDAGHAYYPVVAVDREGNAIAVWAQSDGLQWNIWANRFEPGAGWGIARTIETDNAGFAAWPQVAFDAAGNAVAVWYQSDGTRTNIWANRFVKGSGWGSAQLVERDDGGAATDPQVALDAGGNATAVWSHSDGTRTNIWANRYEPGAGWGTPALLETDNAGFAVRPHVGVDAGGNAVVVWSQSNFFRYSIWSNRFVPGQGWSTRALVETDEAGDAYYPRVTVSPAGEALAVWHQGDGERENIWANRFTPAGGWGTAAPIEIDNQGRALLPRVAGNSRGDAVAVWYQSEGGLESVWANRFVAPDMTAPTLSVDTPAEGLRTNTSSVWVAGRTEPGAQLSVNGLAAAVAADGSYGLRVQLAPGPNLLRVTASDDAGNVASASVNVTYEDPIFDLEARLAAAEAEASAAREEFAVAEAALNASQAELAAARSGWNATQGGLDAALERLAASEARADALEGKLNDTDAELASASTRLYGTENRLMLAEAGLEAADGEIAAARVAANGELSTSVQVAAALASAGLVAGVGAAGLLLWQARRANRKAGAAGEQGGPSKK